jgi:hypothetical protein
MCHAGGGFVEQQQLWFADQRAADFDTTAIDHGQTGNRLEQTIGERRFENFDKRACGRITFLELALEITTSGQVEPKPPD